MSGDENIGDQPGLIMASICLCCLAVLMNVMVFIVTLMGNKTKATVDIYIMNLAVSDALLAGVALPVRVSNGTHKGEDFVGGDVVCKMIMFVPLLTISASIYTMVAISIDRFRVIVLQKSLIYKQALTITLAIWIAALCVSSPQLYEYSIYYRYENDLNMSIISCGSQGIVEKFETVYASIVLLVAYIMPLAVIAGSYTRILTFVWKVSNKFKRNHGVDGNAERTQQSSQVLKNRVKILKLFITITIVFATLWAPYFILFGIEEILDLDDTAETASWPHVIKQIMVTMSTLSNPFLYCVMDSTFRSNTRKVFRKIFSCKQCRRTVAVNPLTTTTSVSKV